MKHSKKYLNLLAEFQNFNSQVQNPRRVMMWWYDVKTNGTYDTAELAHRVSAAAQLGYDVLLERKEVQGKDGLVVYYVTQRPIKPWGLYSAEVYE
jgi:hypothetical protein